MQSLARLLAIACLVALGACNPMRYLFGWEARLRPEAAGRYPWIWPGEWQPAAILADRVLAGFLLRGGYALMWNRVLNQDHFEFRGGGAAGGERAVIRA